LEGERKQVTVLFADMADSLEQISRRDPEEARAFLDPVLELMIDAVHRYEGTVNQVMGDGIMALFGAPIAQEDHALRACYAALRMQEILGVCARKVSPLGGGAVKIRVGVNSGEVVARIFAGDLRMDYSAVGRATHVAARMQQMAEPGTIVASHTTRDLVVGLIRLRPIGVRPVRGLNEPMELFEVVGAEAPRSRFSTQPLASLTRFVGRLAELSRLEALLQSVRQGRGCVATLVGEAGMGKSRLCWEFLNSHRAGGCRVLEATCLAHSRSTPYRPVVELVRACLDITETDDAAAVRAKVEALADSEPVTIAVLWLLGVSHQSSELTDLEPAERRQRVVNAIRHILYRASRAQPLIILFEDVHWADEETRALIDGVVESVPALGVLLLMSCRPEYQHEWANWSFCHQIRLESLPPASAADLLDDLVGRDSALDFLKHMLVLRTDGNPFFLEEMVRMLRETGVLAGARGVTRLARAIETIHVPPKVQPIIAARVDRLAEADKRLLQEAAVVGPDVPFTLLQAVAESGDEGALRASLVRLRRLEFLYESQLYPEPVFSFRHALTHDVVYEGMLSDRRRALHARLVDAIERVYEGRLAEQMERLAYHALRGEQWQRAVRYIRRAAADARERAANREAVAWLDQALVALTRLPETPDTLATSIDVRFEIRASLYALGEFGRMTMILREAEQLARAYGDAKRLGWVAFHLGEGLRLAGRLSEARDHLERARAAADEMGDLALQVAANQYLGLTRHALGDYTGAAANIRTVLSLPLESPEVAGFSQTQAGSRAGFGAVSACWLARCLAETGAFEEAIATGRAALNAARDLRAHPYPVTAARWALGAVHALRGDLERADVLLTEALTGAEAASLAITLPQVQRMLGWVRATSGRVEEGMDLLERALAGAETMGIEVAYPAIWSQLGEVWLMKGNEGKAERFGRMALERARSTGQRGDEARALRLLGDVEARRGPDGYSNAQRRYAIAAATAADANMRPLVALCQLSLGRLFLQAGDAPSAREHLGLAKESFIEMGMASAIAQVTALL
jgi:class 3 adenylate cyclase/tetratricopeptide (TPR) repeat protein